MPKMCPLQVPTRKYQQDHRYKSKAKCENEPDHLLLLYLILLALQALYTQFFNHFPVVAYF